MSLCVVVPARIASVRLPNKPLADIAGKPMIVRVAENLRAVRADQLVVAVDDADVFDVVQAAGFDVMQTRADHTSGSDRVMEVAQRLKLNGRDIVINVQGDEPMMPVSLVDSLADLMRSNSNIQMATVAEPIDSVEDYLNPNVVKVITNQAGRAMYFSRAPIPYIRDRDPKDLAIDELRAFGVRRHVGMYAFTADALQTFVSLDKDSLNLASSLEHIEKLEQLRWLQAGFDIHVVDSPSSVPGGVDTPEDLARVRAHFQ